MALDMPKYTEDIHYVSCVIRFNRRVLSSCQSLMQLGAGWSVEYKDPALTAWHT